MIVEGRGVVSPAPKRVALTNHDRRVLFDAARQLDHYGEGSTGWRGGFVKPIEIPGLGQLTRPQAAIYIGKCGEFAVNELARRRFGALVPPLDLQRRSHGDGGDDLVILALSLQIKTRVTADVNLIKVENEWGKVFPLSGDVNVFCAFPDPHGLIVEVLGWKWTRELAAYRHVPGRRGSHLNIEVPDADIVCMDRLWAEIDSRKGAA